MIATFKCWNNFHIFTFPNFQIKFPHFHIFKLLDFLFEWDNAAHLPHHIDQV